jgi:hypothetical protein
VEWWEIRAASYRHSLENELELHLENIFRHDECGCNTMEFLHISAERLEYLKANYHGKWIG